MAFLLFLLGSLAAFVLASAASVLFGGGGWGLFGLLAMLAVVASVLLLAGLGAGALAFKRLPRGRRAVGVGAGCAALFVGVLAVASLMSANPADSWALLLVLPVLGALAPLLAAKA
jgi:hypothetical protein